MRFTSKQTSWMLCCCVSLSPTTPPPGLTRSQKRMRIINDKRLDTVYEDNGMGTLASVTFEICRKGFFSYDRYDYSIAREELPELVSLLRKAAEVQG